MENEGIMGLPAGQAMQNQGPANQPIYVSSADTYDAALTALGASTNDPTQAEAVRQAVRESIDELDLSPTEMDALLEVLEYMSQNPDQYPQIRQRLIEMNMMEADDLPEAYDPAFLGMAIMALNEAKLGQAQGAAAPMEMAPQMQGMQGTPAAMGFAEGGLADVAKYLAAQGRNGDSILAHITPAEARLLKCMGGSGTINPKTGLPEFFLGKLFKSVKKAVKKLLKNPIVRIIATVALAAVLGPAAISAAGALGGTVAAGTAGAVTAAGIGGSTVVLSSTAAAAASAAAAVGTSAAISAMAGEKINAKNLLVNAATSYFGAGGTVAGFNPVSKLSDLAGKYVPGVTAGSSVAKGIGAGVTSAGIGKLAGMGTEEALGMGLQSGIMAGYQQSQQIKFLKSKSDLELKKLGYSDSQIANIKQGLAPDAPARPATQDGGQQAGGGKQAPAQAPSQAPAAKPLSSLSDNELFMQGYNVDEINQIRGGTGAFGGTAAGGGGGGTAPTQTPGMISRIGDFLSGKKYYTLPDGTVSTEPVSLTNTFGVNPFKEPGTLARYAPGVATALAITGATGGFKAGKVDENPLFNRDYTGESYIRDNPELFKNRVEATKLEPYNPVVPTPSYAQQPQAGAQPGPSTTGQPPQYTAPTIPVTPAPTYVPPPFSVTNQPQGIPQPYNVSGLYGVPLLYGNNQPQPARPPGYAQGGAAVKPSFKNPQHVAQTEAMLYAGPQAAQQTAVAMDYLANKGIMGAQKLRKGGQPTKFPRKTGPINGPGTGTSDSIPAMLSDGEFVFTAKAVRNAGNGSRRKGARRMYKLMKMLEGGKV